MFAETSLAPVLPPPPTLSRPASGFFGERAARALGLDASSANGFAASGLHHCAVTHLACARPTPERSRPIRPERAWSVAVQLRPLERYRLSIGRREQPSARLAPGSVMFLDLQSEIEFAPLDPLDCMQFYIPTRTLDTAAQEQNLMPPSRLDVSSGTAVVDPVLAGLASSLLPALGRSSGMNDLFCEQIMLGLLTHVLHRYGDPRQRPMLAKGGLAPWQLRRVQNLIIAHLGDSVSLVEMAAECGLSPGHFSHAFARSTGMPPHRWLMERRMERAKELLRNSSEPIAEIAAECGFADQAHMTRVFSHAAGTTPARWRRSQQH